MEQSVLDILLGGVRNVARELPEGAYKHLRLSQEQGRDVIFRLRAIPYDEVFKLSGQGAELDVQTVVAGCTDPNFRDKRLAVALGLLKDGEDWGDHGIFPGDCVKALLLSGEISDLARAVQRLSGYLKATLEEVKKN